MRCRRPAWQAGPRARLDGVDARLADRANPSSNKARRTASTRASTPTCAGLLGAADTTNALWLTDITEHRTAEDKLRKVHRAMKSHGLVGSVGQVGAAADTSDLTQPVTFKRRSPPSTERSGVTTQSEFLPSSEWGDDDGVTAPYRSAAWLRPGSGGVQIGQTTGEKDGADAEDDRCGCAWRGNADRTAVGHARGCVARRSRREPEGLVRLARLVRRRVGPVPLLSPGPSVVRSVPQWSSAAQDRHWRRNRLRRTRVSSGGSASGPTPVASPQIPEIDGDGHRNGPTAAGGKGRRPGLKVLETFPSRRLREFTLAAAPPDPGADRRTHRSSAVVKVEANRLHQTEIRSMVDRSMPAGSS